ncbi:hypothetical protein KI387_024066, partial [Taxus chinensis]
VLMKMDKLGGLKMVVMLSLMAVGCGALEDVLLVSSVPVPAPAPATAFVNLTDLLSLAGPFSTFLSLLESTDLLTSVQTQANNTEEGVTIFAPSDKAFASLKATPLSNLTADQKKALILAHVISKFYALSDFQNFSNPANTMATGMNGGKYNLNITAKSGAVSLSSGYVTVPIFSTVHVTYPVALYAISKVLLPEDIFGLPSPSPAPSPAPDAASPEPLSPSSTAKAGVSPATATANADAPHASPASILTANAGFTLLLAPLLM